MSDLLLPRVFTDKSKDGRFQHLNGKPKLSYSQITSWLDDTYKYDYVKQYFAKIVIPSGIFAQAGTDFGTMVEWIGNGCPPDDKPEILILNEQDLRKVINDNVTFKQGSVYEDFIVLDCGDFVIEGYADRSVYYENNGKKMVDILDYKTGNLSKSSKYSSPKYMQTRLYAYQKELEGYEIGDCSVEMYGRKGNGSDRSPLKLTGDILNIPTPYVRKDVEKWLKSVAGNVAKDISDSYKVYLKIFG